MMEMVGFRLSSLLGLLLPRGTLWWDAPVQEFFKPLGAEACVNAEHAFVAGLFNFLPADASCSGNINHLHSRLEKLAGDRAGDAAADFFDEDWYRKFCRDGGNCIEHAPEVCPPLGWKSS